MWVLNYILPVSEITLIAHVSHPARNNGPHLAYSCSDDWHSKLNHQTGRRNWIILFDWSFSLILQTELTASEYLLVEDCSIWTEKCPLPVWSEALVPSLISVLSAYLGYWWVSSPHTLHWCIMLSKPSLRVNIINSTNIWKINYKLSNCHLASFVKIFEFCIENIRISINR